MGERDKPSAMLQSLIDALARDPEEQRLFHMTEYQIRWYLGGVDVTDTGIDVSPQFQSPGWGENTDLRPDVNASDVGMNPSVTKHELKHALHMFACVRVFEDPDFQEEAVERFRQHVLADDEFLRWTTEHTNEFGQENIRKAQSLISSHPDEQTIRENAILLGAIAYQHAYYVDPGMCEAIASFKDEGLFLQFNSFLNRNFGLMLPGRQAFEGYMNREWQEIARKANPLQLTLMVKKEVYDKDPTFHWQQTSD